MKTIVEDHELNDVRETLRELLKLRLNVLCDDETYPYPPLCPHGHEWHECDACMRESDFQYDCAREREYFR